jgi:hypothetical protein
MQKATSKTIKIRETFSPTVQLQISLHFAQWVKHQKAAVFAIKKASRRETYCVKVTKATVQ